MAKGADPFDLLLLLLTPLEQVECLSGRFRWTRRWRRLGVVVVVHQAGAGVVKVVVVVVAVVVVEEIVGRALDSFSPAQVGQEAPEDEHRSDTLPKSYSRLPPFATMIILVIMVLKGGRATWTLCQIIFIIFKMVLTQRTTNALLTKIGLKSRYVLKSS